MKTQHVVFVALVAVFVAACATNVRGDDGLMKLKLLSGNARCLDGSPSGYYYEESPTSSSDWVVFMQGGGVCHSVSGCIARSHTRLGSSKGWSSTYTDTNNLLSRNCTFNPFCNHNHVFVPYCSGDVYLGQDTSPSVIGLYFAGHLTVEAVFKDLQSTYGLGSGDKDALLFAGSSAGALGTFENADFVSEMLPTVDVKAAPQSGFFFPNITAYPYWAMGKFVYPENRTELGLFDAFQDQSCLKDAADKILCDDMFYLYKYISTPLFVAENQYDSNQIFNQLLAPQKNTSETRAYIRYFGGMMRAALSQVQAPNGLYSPSCLCHTADMNMVQSPSVKGYTMASALSAWYNGETVVVSDDCGDEPCNPECNCSP